MGIKKHGSCWELWAGRVYLLVSRRPFTKAQLAGHDPIVLIKLLEKE